MEAYDVVPLATLRDHFLMLVAQAGSRNLQADTEPETEASHPEFVASLGAIDVRVRLSSRSALFDDPASTVCVITVGELCHDGTAILDREMQVRNAHAQYLLGGIAGLTAWLNGSFLVCVIDRREQEIHLITDRLGSKKAFILHLGESIYVSSSMHLLPYRDIDPVGAAIHLINGFNFSGKTVLDGVNVLAGASVHSFSARGQQHSCYWRFDLSKPALSPTIEHARDDLARLIRAAVRVRIPPRGRIFISLSGGIDSRAILGCLLEAVPERNRLIAFSYGVASDSDVLTAARLAKHAAIEHRIYGFCGDLATTLRRNGRLNEGMIPAYTHGLDALLAAEHDFKEGDVLFVGDIPVRRERSGFVDVDDVLDRGVEIQSPAVVPGYYSAGDYDADTIRDSINSALSELKRCLPPLHELQALHDYLYLTQRVSNMILPWRGFHASRFVTVANPLVDNSILDFYETQPAAFRLNKALHRQTIPEMFPDLCALPFGASGVNNHPVHVQLSSHREALTRLIDDFDSRLDALLPPALLRFALRDTAQRKALDSWPLTRPVRALVHRIRRRLLGWELRYTRVGGRRSMKSSLPLPALGVDQLERALALRCFLAESRSNESGGGEVERPR